MHLPVAAHAQPLPNARLPELLTPVQRSLNGFESMELDPEKNHRQWRKLLQNKYDRLFELEDGDGPSSLLPEEGEEQDDVDEDEEFFDAPAEAPGPSTALAEIDNDDDNSKPVYSVRAAYTYVLRVKVLRAVYMKWWSYYNQPTSAIVNSPIIHYNGAAWTLYMNAPGKSIISYFW